MCLTLGFMRVVNCIRRVKPLDWLPWEGISLLKTILEQVVHPSKAVYNHDWTGLLDSL